MNDSQISSKTRGNDSFTDWAVAYHAILPEETTYLYDVSAALFEEHLQLLLSRESEKQKHVGVTFDDGHRSNYETAFPVLEKSRVRATFFLLAGSLGTSAHYLTWEQAREMAEAGHQMQSHGWSHTLLTSCSEKQIQEEVDRSKKTIEDRLGTAVDSISAPGGRWNRRVIELCSKSGYKFFYHSNPWRGPIEFEGVRIQGRMMMTGKMRAAELQQRMDCSPLRRRLHLGTYRTKEIVRSLMGDALYHNLWKWAAHFDSDSQMEIGLKSKPVETLRTHNGTEDTKA